MPSFKERILQSGDSPDIPTSVIPDTLANSSLGLSMMVNTKMKHRGYQYIHNPHLSKEVAYAILKERILQSGDSPDIPTSVIPDTLANSSLGLSMMVNTKMKH